MSDIPNVVVRIVRRESLSAESLLDTVKRQLDKMKFTHDLQVLPNAEANQPIEETFRQMARGVVALEIERPGSLIYMFICVTRIAVPGESGSSMELPIIIVVSKGAFSPLKIEVRAPLSEKIPEHVSPMVDGIAASVLKEIKLPRFKVSKNGIEFARDLSTIFFYEVSLLFILHEGKTQTRH